MDTISAGLVKAYPKEYSASGVIFTPLRELLARPGQYAALHFVWSRFICLAGRLRESREFIVGARHESRTRSCSSHRARCGTRQNCSSIACRKLFARISWRSSRTDSGILDAAVFAAIGSRRSAAARRQCKLDWRVLAFAFFAALLTGILSGLAPAFRLSKTDVHESLKEGARGSSTGASRRLRGILVVSEVALSVTLAGWRRTVVAQP